MLNKTDHAIFRYAEAVSSEIDPLLKELERTTHLKTLNPTMLSGTLQGQLLRWISNWQRPKYILEIGTFTGYASLCLASGLAEDGKLITIEINPELQHISQAFFDRSTHAEQIEALIGNAIEVVPALNYEFDLVFLDGHKPDYLTLYELIIPKLSNAGLLLADNVLWDAKVIDRNASDKSTLALKEFNQHVKNDNRVENLLIPFRDGIMMVKKTA